MTKQSKIGQELNRLMLETGMTPLQTIQAAMEAGALNIGNHTFIPKPASKAKE